MIKNLTNKFLIKNDAPYFEIIENSQKYFQEKNLNSYREKERNDKIRILHLCQEEDYFYFGETLSKNKSYIMNGFGFISNQKDNEFYLGKFSEDNFEKGIWIKNKDEIFIGDFFYKNSKEIYQKTNFEGIICNKNEKIVNFLIGQFDFNNSDFNGISLNLNMEENNNNLAISDYGIDKEIRIDFGSFKNNRKNCEEFFSLLIFEKFKLGNNNNNDDNNSEILENFKMSLANFNDDKLTNDYYLMDGNSILRIILEKEKNENNNNNSNDFKFYAEIIIDENNKNIYRGGFLNDFNINNNINNVNNLNNLNYNNNNINNIQNIQNMQNMQNIQNMQNLQNMQNIKNFPIDSVIYEQTPDFQNNLINNNNNTNNNINNLNQNIDIQMQYEIQQNQIQENLQQQNFQNMNSINNINNLTMNNMNNMNNNINNINNMNMNMNMNNNINNINNISNLETINNLNMENLQIPSEEMALQAEAQGNENHTEEEDNLVLNYVSDKRLYACGFQKNNKVRMAISTLEFSVKNRIEILEFSKEGDKLNKICTEDTDFPLTKIMWGPEGSYSNTLATSSDIIRLYKYDEEQEKLNLACSLNNKKSKYSMPLTSFDWNSKNPSILGTASLDTTCTIWDLNKFTIRTQLIAHDKEVFDIAFSQNEHIFISTGADGSIRLFDLRTLDHSTIMFETKDPISRIAFNTENSYLISAMGYGKEVVNIIDSRVAMTSLVDLKSHNKPVTGMAWAPNSGAHICTVGEDSLVLIWNIENQIENPSSGPFLSYKAPEEISNVTWCNDHHEWIGITFENQLQLLRV